MTFCPFIYAEKEGLNIKIEQTIKKEMAGSIQDTHQAERYWIGAWVLLYLAVLLVLATLLKQEYWKDLK